jgi:hypothetical protein
LIIIPVRLKIWKERVLKAEAKKRGPDRNPAPFLKSNIL